jgi:hypothetical protein
MLRPSLSRDVLDGVPARTEILPDETGAIVVSLAWRVDGRDANQVARIFDQFVARAIDFGQNAVYDLDVMCQITSTRYA